MQDNETPTRRGAGAYEARAIPRRCAAGPSTVWQDHACAPTGWPLLRRRTAVGAPPARARLGKADPAPQPRRDRRSAGVAGTVPATASRDRRRPPAQWPLPAARLSVPDTDARGLGVARGTACARRANALPAERAGDARPVALVARGWISRRRRVTSEALSVLAAGLPRAHGTARPACMGAPRAPADHRPSAAHAGSDARPALG